MPRANALGKESSAINQIFEIFCKIFIQQIFLLNFIKIDLKEVSRLKIPFKIKTTRTKGTTAAPA